MPRPRKPGKTFSSKRKLYKRGKRGGTSTTTPPPRRRKKRKLSTGVYGLPRKYGVSPSTRRMKRRAKKIKKGY